jgi:hypothetical protein
MIEILKFYYQFEALGPRRPRKRKKIPPYGGQEQIIKFERNPNFENLHHGTHSLL